MKFKAYLRVSTDQQAEFGFGLDAQKIACENYARKFNRVVDQFYVDDGYSAALPIDKRPALLQAMISIEKDDVILVAKRDRLGRDVVLVALIENEIKRKGGKVISLAGEGTDNDDPSSLLMRRIVDSFGEYERNIIKARTKAAMAVKKGRNERVGYIPYGKKLSDDGTHLEANDEEQSVIQVIKDLRSEGMAFRKIASHLNQNRIFNRSGRSWNHVSVFILISKISQFNI